MKRTLFKSGLLVLICVLTFAAQPVVSTQAGKPYDEHPGPADSTVAPSPEGTPEPRERQRPLPAKSLDVVLATGTIVTNTTPLALAEAMGIPAANIVSASFSGSDPLAFGVGNAPLGYHFPTSGNIFALMSTGLAGSADAPNVETYLSYVLGGFNNAQGNDIVRFTVELIVPPSANCASFDVAYYSEEFPEFIGSQFNDTFTAELGGTNLTISGNQVIAPLNFAFDVANNPISVNTVSGVISPTNSTYDGKTALRRAQTPVTPGQIATIVWTVQDLGDSYYDSATFLDNFSFTYNPSCNPGVEPPITPQGNLQLHMSSALPTGATVKPSVTVLNQSTGPVAYTLVVQFWRDIAKRDERIYPISFSSSGSQLFTADFGIQPPDTYYIVAELYQGGEQLERRQKVFSVGLGYLKLNTAASGLTDAAYAEINDGQEIAVDALTKATQSAPEAAIEWLLDKLSPGINKLVGVNGLDAVTVAGAGLELVFLINQLAEIATFVGQVSYSAISDQWRSASDNAVFNGRRSTVVSAQDTLLGYAEGKNFNWNPVWDFEVAHYKTAIENKNETDQIGLGIEVGLSPPSLHLATLTEMKGQFDSIIPDLSAVLDIAVIGLAAILVALALIGAVLAIVGTFGGAVIVAPPALAGFATFIMSALAAAGKVKAIVVPAVTILFAVTISSTAGVIISPSVVQEHQNAMNYLKARIDGGLESGAVTDLSLSTNVHGNVVTAQSKLSDKTAPAFLSTELFRADGRLMHIEPYGMLASGSSANQEWKLNTGSYWLVGTARGKNDVTAKRTAIQIANARVELNLSIDKDVLVVGQAIKASVTLRNLDSSNATGSLTVGISTLEGEGLQLWTPSLEPGQTVVFEHIFVPQSEGGFVMRASVGNASGTIARADRAFAVGDHAAVALQFTPDTIYVPSQPVIFNITAVNAGTQPTTTVVTLNTYDRNAGYAQVYTSTFSLSIGSKSSSVLTLTALPSALPGAYSTRLRVDDHLYRVDDYLVRADGTLFTIVQADPTRVALGETTYITVEVQNETYAYTDADISLQLITPDGQTLNLPVQPVSAGRYQAVYAPSVLGTFIIKPTVSKPNYRSEVAETFFICQDASLLQVSTQGQLVLTETVPITFTVRNEFGLPLPNATVVVSGVNGLLADKTDASGNARLVVKTLDTNPVQVHVEKPGFATSGLQLPVATQPDTSAPPLTLSLPKSTNQPNANYFGKTELRANLAVQGFSVPVAANGLFTATVNLVEGDNVVVATATDAAQNGTTITKTIMLDTVSPNLIVSEPQEGSTTANAVVRLQGVLELGAGLVIDGQAVPVQSDGSFSIWLLLNKVGLNTITFRAVDAVGNETIQQRTIKRLAVQHLPAVLR